MASLSIMGFVSAFSHFVSYISFQWAKSLIQLTKPKPQWRLPRDNAPFSEQWLRVLSQQENQIVDQNTALDFNLFNTSVSSLSLSKASCDSIYKRQSLKEMNKPVLWVSLENTVFVLPLGIKTQHFQRTSVYVLFWSIENGPFCTLDWNQLLLLLFHEFAF